MAQGRAALSPSRDDCYAVLGLAPGATRPDVKRAFRAVKDAYEHLRDAVPADARAARVHGAYATTVDLDLRDFPAAPARPARRPAPAPAPAARPAHAGAFASLLQDAIGRLATA